MRALTRANGASLIFTLSLAATAVAQDPGWTAPQTGFLGPAEIHAGGRPDIPQPPHLVTAVPKLPGHGLPPVPVGPDNGLPQPASAPTSPGGNGPGAPCTVRYFVNRAVEPSGANQSTVGEPSVATNLDTCLMTGNWYAALSQDAGMSWDYISPYSQFASIDSGFCCDQRTTYVPSRDMTVWYLQYGYSATTQRGSVRIAISSSRTNLRNNTWHSWTFSPQTFGLGNGLWMDFPDIAYSDNHLYCTSNVFNPADVYQNSVVWKMNLDDLDNAAGLLHWYWTRSATAAIGGGPSYRFVQGATGTMYLASHNSTSSIRVFRNADNPSNAPMASSDRNVSSWSGGSFQATSPGGSNWAGRADSRVQTGYVSGNEYGFLWHVGRRPTSGRPQCYIRVAKFSTATHDVTGQEDIWNSPGTLAIMYPACATNDQGDVAVTWAFGQGDGAAGWHPTTGVRIVDGSCQATFGGGTFSVPFFGNTSPTRDAWGDYFTVQRHSTEPRTFVATGMTQRGSSSNSGQEPRYLWFGFESDTPTTPTVTVEDSGAPGAVAITVTQTDLDGNKNGSTPFDRRYTRLGLYELTAPETHTSGSNTYVFCRWQLDVNGGTNFNDYPDGQRTLTVASIGGANDRARAAYALQSTITVDDINVAGGVPITVGTTDMDGNKNGTTSFTRRYKVDNAGGFSFTAPAIAGNGQRFRRWYLGATPQPIGQLTVVAIPAFSAVTISAEYCSFAAGTYTRYERGCQGSNGLAPLHSSTSNPEIGRVAVHTASNFFGATSAAMFLGFSRSTWNGTPLPLSLGILGADPSCNVLAEGALVLPVAIGALGSGQTNVPIAADANLIGTNVYTQVIGIDPFVASPLKVIVSNGLAMKIGGSSLGGQICP